MNSLLETVADTSLHDNTKLKEYAIKQASVGMPWLDKVS
jgi:hypothetical protein